MTCHSGKLASGTLQVILSWWTSLRIFCHLWLLVSRIKKESASTRPKGHYQSWLYLSCGICVASCVCVGGGCLLSSFQRQDCWVVLLCCRGVSGECCKTRCYWRGPATAPEVFFLYASFGPLDFHVTKKYTIDFFFSFHVLTYKET